MADTAQAKHSLSEAKNRLDLESEEEVRQYIIGNREQWFRPFPEGLCEFIRRTSSDGTVPKSKNKQIQYIIKLRDSKEMTIPSDSTIEAWVKGKKKSSRPSRKNAIALCFVFGANLTQTKWFLNNVCFMASLSDHIIEEACYKFCIERALPYREAMEMAEEIRSTPFEPISHSDRICTQQVSEELCECSTKEIFLAYMKMNRSQFQANYITARKEIAELHEELIHEKEDSEFIAKCVAGNVKLEAPESCGLLVRYYNRYYNQNGIKWNINAKYKVSPKLIYNLVIGSKQKYKMGNRPEVVRIIDSNFPGCDVLRRFWETQDADATPTDDSEMLRKQIIFLSYVCCGTLKILKNQDETVFSVQTDDLLNSCKLPKLYEGNPFDVLMILCSFASDPISILSDFICESSDDGSYED